MKLFLRCDTSSTVSMKSSHLLFAAALFSALAAPTACAQSVPKTNPQKVYMHYMPWFETPATLGGSNWGYHWKFNNRNPNVVDAEGRRQIAAHYYPKIGPYASSDPDVIEYHLLLMKLSGVDGVLIDWYGVQGANGDVGSLLTNSNALVGKMDDFGLKFGVVLEDRFSTVSIGDATPDISKAKANVAYLKNNYFNKAQYIRLGPGNDPLMLNFGPIRFMQPAQWTEILAEAGEDVAFLPLWYKKHLPGANADGEFAWIYEDANDHLTYHQKNFDILRAPTLSVAGGTAYPGFNDFYQEGGTSTVIGFEIPHNHGQTLADTLALADQYSANLDFVQLATFNDFGEGTMFEPTVETGFDYLAQLQQFTGVPYGEDELELVYKLFRLRKENAGNAAVQAQLGQASANLTALDIEAARSILDAIALPGDFDDDGDADGADFMRWQQQLGSRGLFPLNSLAADGNADGVVDALDLQMLFDNFGASAASIGAVTSPSTPEPGGSHLTLIATLAAWLLRGHFPR
jgi:hypothetical protein